MKSYLAIIIGGSAGCLIRWLLGARLNSLFPDLPPGTLVVNLAGGFIIGKRAARTVLTGMCYSVGSATRQGSSSPTRFIGQSAMTSRT